MDHNNDKNKTKKLTWSWINKEITEKTKEEERAHAKQNTPDKLLDKQPASKQDIEWKTICDPLFTSYYYILET